MILGLSFADFTFLHTVISLIGIVSGLAFLVGLLSGRSHPALTTLFLGSTILTSVTGFMFPLTQIGPPHIVGAISLVVLAVALVALLVFHLSGAWRWIYVASAVASLYLNVFVGVVQAFQKLSFFQQLAPTQSEPPFLVAQVVTLVVFVVAGIIASRTFHPERPIGAIPV